MYLENIDRGSKTNRGGLKHMKVDNKTVRQYENPYDSDKCVANIFATYLSLHTEYRGMATSIFAHCPMMLLVRLSFSKQSVVHNTLAKLIPNIMCNEAGIEGYKTEHFHKNTCATTLHRQRFSDQLIKERTGHRSIEGLHQYKRTMSN